MSGNRCKKMVERTSHMLVLSYFFKKYDSIKYLIANMQENANNILKWRLNRINYLMLVLLFSHHYSSPDDFAVITANIL